MKILVTGGAGFIGSHVVDAYLDAGHQVLAVDDLSTGNRSNVNPDAEFQLLDIRSEAFMNCALQWKPDVINHHAAQVNLRTSVVDPINDADRNIVGSLAILEAARAAGSKKVIFISSGGAIYGEPEILPCSEDHPIKPESPYGLSKYVTERYLDIYKNIHGLDYTTLRYANVYGPRQDPHGEAGVVAIFTDRLLAGETVEVFGSGEQQRDFVYVGDVVNANIQALEKGSQAAVNIATGVPTSVNEVFKVLKDTIGYQKSPVYQPAKPGEVFSIYLSYALAGEVLGWQPQVSFSEGIAKTVEAVREQRIAR